MPELPEVETVRRTLKHFILNKKIKNIQVNYPKVIDGDCNEFIEVLKNQTINDIDRIGKYLIFILDTNAFVGHLRMEGKFQITDPNLPFSKHEHVIFDFDDGMQLRYHDVRKFGRMQLVDIHNYKNELPLSKLGKEPFDINYEELYKQLKRKSLPLKTCLLDQTMIAGIGNIYANEILYEMNLHPEAKPRYLTKKRVNELVEVSKDILNRAIKQGGTTIHSFNANGIDGLFQVELNVHMKKTCPLGHDIKKIFVHGRGTYYCPICQKGRK